MVALRARVTQITESKRRRATAGPRGAPCSRQREWNYRHLPSGREQGRSHVRKKKCTNSHCARIRVRAPSGIVSADSVAPPLSCPLMRASTRTIGRSLVTTATLPQTLSVQPLADMALEDVSWVLAPHAYRPPDPPPRPENRPSHPPGRGEGYPLHGLQTIHLTRRGGPLRAAAGVHLTGRGDPPVTPPGELHALFTLEELRGLRVTAVNRLGSCRTV